MTSVAIDPTKGSRKVFTCPHELAAEINHYRRERETIPPESQAVVELIRLGLEKWKKERERKVRGRRT
jgi:hypothetical protein